MQSIKDLASTKILKALHDHGRLYTLEIPNRTGITIRHIDRVLPDIVKDHLVTSYKEGKRTYYELTDLGEATIWGIYNPEELVELYQHKERYHQKEERLRSQVRGGTPIVSEKEWKVIQEVLVAARMKSSDKDAIDKLAKDLKKRFGKENAKS